MVLRVAEGYTHKEDKEEEVPCPKKGDVTHALSETHWQHSAIESFLPSALL